MGWKMKEKQERNRRSKKKGNRRKKWMLWAWIEKEFTYLS